MIGRFARTVVNTWVRVLVKGTLTLAFLACALAWLAVLVPAAGLFHMAGAVAWGIVTVAFVGLMTREARLRRRDGGMY